jgi:hypothetical protein
VVLQARERSHIWAPIWLFPYLRYDAWFKGGNIMNLLFAQHYVAHHHGVSAPNLGCLVWKAESLSRLRLLVGGCGGTTAGTAVPPTSRSSGALSCVAYVLEGLLKPPLRNPPPPPPAGAVPPEPHPCCIVARARPHCTTPFSPPPLGSSLCCSPPLPPRMRPFRWPAVTSRPRGEVHCVQHVMQ